MKLEIATYRVSEMIVEEMTGLAKILGKMSGQEYQKFGLEDSEIQALQSAYEIIAGELQRRGIPA